MFYKIIKIPIKIFAVILLSLTGKIAYSETNVETVYCSLMSTGTEFTGTCSIPCQVNALKVNFDKLLETCKENTPPREVQASLRKMDGKGNYLGKMEGKYLKDPTRFEISDSKYV